jgi:hypothetical protein
MPKSNILRITFFLTTLICMIFKHINNMTITNYCILTSVLGLISDGLYQILNGVKYLYIMQLRYDALYMT